SQYRCRQDEVAVTPVALAGRHAEIEGAKHEVRAAERAGATMAIAQTRQCQRRQVCAGGFTPDEQSIAAELPLGVLDQPARGGLPVVGPGGEWVSRSQTVLDADRRQVRRGRQQLEQRVLLVRAAQPPTAAVQVEVDAGDALGNEYPQPNLARRPRD